VQLLGAELASGQTLTDSKVGLGDELGLIVAGTVDTIGNAAATTVSAPITTVEGKTNNPPPDELETILKGDATTQ
jgi:esterase/lipase superfamily enzyme